MIISLFTQYSNGDLREQLFSKQDADEEEDQHEVSFTTKHLQSTSNTLTEHLICEADPVMIVLLYTLGRREGPATKEYCHTKQSI